MFSHVRGWGMGGCNNVPDDCKTVAHKGQIFVPCNRWGSNNSNNCVLFILFIDVEP